MISQHIRKICLDQLNMNYEHYPVFICRGNISLGVSFRLPFQEQLNWSSVAFILWRGYVHLFSCLFLKVGPHAPLHHGSGTCIAFCKAVVFAGLLSCQVSKLISFTKGVFETAERMWRKQRKCTNMNGQSFVGGNFPLQWLQTVKLR